MPDRLDRWRDDVNFFSIVRKTVFEPSVAYVTFPRWQEVIFFLLILKISSFSSSDKLGGE